MSKPDTLASEPSPNVDLAGAPAQWRKRALLFIFLAILFLPFLGKSLSVSCFLFRCRSSECWKELFAGRIAAARSPAECAL